MMSLKETIYLIPNVNESSFLNMLSINGMNSFGKRIFDSLELAKYALIKNGFLLEKDFINNNDAASLLYSDIKKIDYFNDYTYLDVVHFLQSLNKLRKIIDTDEAEKIASLLPMENFPNKNRAIIDAYNLYINLLNKNNYIDEIQIIRKAIDKNCQIKDIEFRCFKEFKLGPLDVKLLDTVSLNSYIEENFDIEMKPNIKSYTRAFGEINEVENILGFIIKNKIPFDQCVIAVADTTSYTKLFENAAQTLKLPITLGTNFTILETNPGKLFTLIENWYSNLFNGDYLKEMLFSNVFDLEKFRKDAGIPSDFDTFNTTMFERKNKIDIEKIVEMVGDLSLSFDADENTKKVTEYNNLINIKYKECNDESDVSERECFKYVEGISHILNKGIINFVSEYTSINCYSTAKDESAKAFILNQLISGQRYNIPFEELSNVINSALVGSESAKPGQIFVTSINKALSNIRKNVFVVGVSSNYFPGNVKEDSIILDEDYECFGLAGASKKIIEDNKNSYQSLINMATKFGSDIYLSYSFYNSQNLKAQNSSSVVFETYMRQFGKDKNLGNFSDSFDGEVDGVKFKTVEFFNEFLEKSDVIGKEYCAQKNLITSKSESEDVSLSVVRELKTRAFSPSAIEMFTECQYKFFLSYVIGIPQEDKTNIYEVIPDNDFGTLAHSLLENLNKKLTSETEFKERAGIVFDEYRIKHPTDNDVVFNKTKEEFLKMMMNAYEMEEDEPSPIKEFNIECTHVETGIKIHGFPDKVVQLPDKGDGRVHYHVVDYKTGRTIKHSKTDVKTLIQATIYSYILEHRKFSDKKPRDVDSFEYRYIRLPERICCDDLSSCYDNLTSVLQDLKNAFEQNIFQKNGKNICKYCPFRSVCAEGKK